MRQRINRPGGEAGAGPVPRLCVMGETPDDSLRRETPL